MPSATANSAAASASSIVAGSRSAMMADYWLLHLVGNAEIEPRGLGDEATELDCNRIVEAEFLAQPQPILQRRVLADHLVDGVADEAKQHEGQKRHRQHDDERLEQPADCEREHLSAA